MVDEEVAGGTSSACQKHGLGWAQLDSMDSVTMHCFALWITYTQ
jgi:hypothetical protein